ncbi:MAG: hypothetical protein GXX92_04445 [Clostridiales bacterium]|nr:hypothetical protein [Clostridiales bacterium]
MKSLKDLIESFEDTFGVSFVDEKTGKKILDLIAIDEQKKNCMTCKWAMNGDGKNLHEEDTVCVNGDSEHVTERVTENMTCDLWEQED